jgi:hypothetical protein
MDYNTNDLFRRYVFFIFCPFHILNNFLVPRKHVLHYSVLSCWMLCITRHMYISVSMHPYPIQLTTLSPHCTFSKQRLNYRLHDLVMFPMQQWWHRKVHMWGYQPREDEDPFTMILYIVCTFHWTWSTE